MSKTSPVYLSVKDAAHFLRISRHTLYEWVAGRKIPHRKVGSRVVFRRTELIEFYESHYVPPQKKPQIGYKVNVVKPDEH